MELATIFYLITFLNRLILIRIYFNFFSYDYPQYE